MNNKQELRQKCLAKRFGFGEAFIREKSVEICRLLSGTEEIRRARTVLLYYPIKNELSVLHLVDTLRAEGKRIGFPVCLKAQRRLIFREISSLEALKVGSYGIPEPNESYKELIPDESTLCIVPGAAFSRGGSRLGYGAGYYDRFLSDFEGISVGITCSELLFDSLPSEPHDALLDMIITEGEVLRFERKA